MGPKSNIGPKTSWDARDRPELNLEEKFSRRNNLPEIVAGRRPPPPCCVRRLAARLPQQVRRMALVAPTSGATFIFWPAIIAQQLRAKQQHHTVASAQQFARPAFGLLSAARRDKHAIIACRTVQP
ncbi:hypothetical protein F511_10000 [Dorcoceras hygrometricum]|uniref:Uncharacterized protein n=1 Tax=Dorcoceras hygrometricum TaxID=472368 RepID=A0A2Z7AJB8_9LAMI|nr:hypothetical protein F511_10000 [Dorcoceras hygrometricum]